MRPWGRVDDKEAWNFCAMWLWKECGKFFQDYINMKRHIIRNHIIWSCEDCGGGIKLSESVSNTHKAKYVSLVF